MEIYCSKCNSYSYRAVPATGHKSVTDKAVAPTCTTPGCTAGSHCKTCGEVLVAQETIPQLGHNYSYTYNSDTDTYTAVCSTCNEVLTEFDNDLDALIAAIEKAKSINAENYSPESYARLYEAIAPYLDLNEEDGLAYPQYAIDAKTSEILTRIELLAPYMNFTFKSAVSEPTMTYDGEEYAQGTYNVPFGAELTVTAPEVDGYNFTGWYDADTKKLVTTDSTYTFKINSNTTYRASYVQADKVVLTFSNLEGQIYGTVSKTVKEWAKITSLSNYIPRVPYRYGYENAYKRRRKRGTYRKP